MQCRGLKSPGCSQKPSRLVSMQPRWDAIIMKTSSSPPWPNVTFAINICRLYLGTYHILLTQMQWKLLRYDCGILQKNFVDSLWEEKVNAFSQRLHWISGSCREEKKIVITIASSNHKQSDLCEPAHKVSQSLWIRTLQLLDNLETLV